MPRTITDILNDTFIQLAEATQSTFAQLETGGGNTASIATTAVLTRFADLAQWELAKTCLLIPGQGATGAAVGQSLFVLSSLSAQMAASGLVANLATDQSTLWAVRDVSYAGSPLTFAGVEALKLRFNAYRTASGNPAYWWRDGDNSIGIWPAPATAAQLTAFGYCLGPSFTASATCTWITDNDAQYIAVRAAILAAEERYDDPTLFGRVGHLRGEYEEFRRERFRKLSPTVAGDIGMTEPPMLSPPQQQQKGQK